MLLLGWLLATLGVVLLALLGWQLWYTNPPQLLGLSLGQILVVLAAIIAVGLVVIGRAARRGATVSRP